MLRQLTIHPGKEQAEIFKNPAITTALVPFIGHKKAQMLAQHMKEEGIDIFESNQQLNILSTEKIQQILNPASLTARGFSLKDLNSDTWNQVQ